MLFFVVYIWKELHSQIFCMFIVQLGYQNKFRMVLQFVLLKSEVRNIFDVNNP